MRWDFRLKPRHASLLGLKSRSLRRAKARSGQRETRRGYQRASSSLRMESRQPNCCSKGWPSRLPDFLALRWPSKLSHASSSRTWAITRCASTCSHGPASEAATWALVFGGVIRNNTYVLLFC